MKTGASVSFGPVSGNGMTGNGSSVCPAAGPHGAAFSTGLVSVAGCAAKGADPSSGARDTPPRICAISCSAACRRRPRPNTRTVRAIMASGTPTTSAIAIKTSKVSIMCPVCPVLTGSLDHAMGKRAVKPASRVTDKAIVAQRPQHGRTFPTEPETRLSDPWERHPPNISLWHPSARTIRSGRARSRR